MLLCKKKKKFFIKTVGNTQKKVYKVWNEKKEILSSLLLFFDLLQKQITVFSFSCYSFSSFFDNHLLMYVSVAKCFIFLFIFYFFWFDFNCAEKRKKKKEWNDSIAHSVLPYCSTSSKKKKNTIFFSSICKPSTNKITTVLWLHFFFRFFFFLFCSNFLLEINLILAVYGLRKIIQISLRSKTVYCHHWLISVIYFARNIFHFH